MRTGLSVAPATRRRTGRFAAPRRGRASGESKGGAEARRAQLYRGGQPIGEQLPVDAVGHPLQQWAGQLGQAGPAVDAGRVRLLRQPLHEEFRQRHRARQSRLEGGRAFGAYQRVRIMAVWQEQELELLPALQRRQRILQRAPGRRAPGAVAVEAEHDVVGQPGQALEVIGRRCRAEGRAGVADSVLGEGDDVHIAFDDQNHRNVAQRLAHLVGAVQLAALVKERRLRRIQVLRIVFAAFAEDAPAKGDHTAARVADGEHQPMAETVVEPLPAVVGGALDDQPGLEQMRGRARDPIRATSTACPMRPARSRCRTRAAMSSSTPRSRR